MDFGPKKQPIQNEPKVPPPAPEPNSDKPHGFNFPQDDPSGGHEKPGPEPSPIDPMVHKPKPHHDGPQNPQGFRSPENSADQPNDSGPQAPQLSPAPEKPRPPQPQSELRSEPFASSSRPSPSEPAGIPATAGSYGDSEELPTPVVKVLSVKGVEHVMMTFALWFVAGSPIWIILSLINGYKDFLTLALPTALLIVSLPIFALFFVRLRRVEIAEPKLRFEPSKRRLSQITQVVAFAVCFFSTVGFVYTALQKLGGEGDASLVKSFFSMLTVLVIAGGILAYYWLDEHRRTRRW